VWQEQKRCPADKGFVALPPLLKDSDDIISLIPAPAKKELLPAPGSVPDYRIQFGSAHSLTGQKNHTHGLHPRSGRQGSTTLLQEVWVFLYQADPAVYDYNLPHRSGKARGLIKSYYCFILSHIAKMPGLFLTHNHNF